MAQPIGYRASRQLTVGTKAVKLQAQSRLLLRFAILNKVLFFFCEREKEKANENTKAKQRLLALIPN